MVAGLSGSVRRTPAKASEEEAGNGKKAPAATLVHVAAKDSDVLSSQHPLLAIRTPASRFKRKLEWPVETASKLLSSSRFGRPLPRGEETPSRVSAAAPRGVVSALRVHRIKTTHGGSVQRKPTKSVTKPACIVSASGGARGLGLGSGYLVPAKGLPATVVNSAEVPHYELQEDPLFWMENNVQVVIRVRPLNNTEKSLHGYNRCLKQESAQRITWIGHPEACFTFDHVACESVNQEVLFRVVGVPMIENCMAGYNSCVFSYGQTGSGKTHTMLGEISELGVKPGPECGMIPRIFELLIARIRAEEESRRDENLKYTCKCSFLEIYNEQITDLLDPSSTNLPLRENTTVGAYVENLTKHEVTRVGDIITLLMQSSVNRKVSATNMNSASSRSHTVFTCSIESRWEKDSICNSWFARLNLVDLAGSERQTASGAEGERLKEASSINKSLSTLSHVIMSLVDRTFGKKRHVPYRDSKLTFLLQDSLGGNSKTLIIANVSPSLCSSNETLSTLKFAQRARGIQNNAIVNEDCLGDTESLQHQICVLKEELAVIKGQGAVQTHGALEAEEQCNADVVCHLRREWEAADNELQMLRSQIAKLLQEKENAMECHLKSQGTIEDLSSEVLQLKSEIIDKEKCYEARLKELEIQMQEKDSDAAASLILWHNDKEEELAVIKGQRVLQTHQALEAEEQFNADLICHPCKKRESADNELQMLQSQIAKLLHENENAIECHLKSQGTIQDLSSEVLQLKSEIIDKEKCYEARLKELELKMQEKDSDAAASLILWHNEKEALQFEVLEAKGVAQQKSFEASILTAKFQDAQATIANAESTTVKALMEANENAKLQAEKYKQKESSFIIEKDNLLSEISSLKMLLDAKELNYQDMEKKFKSSLLEANEVASELKDDIRLLQNLQNDFSKLSDEKQCCDSQVRILRDKLEKAQAVAEESEAIATEARQIADERKRYAEEKDEEVKLLESSIEDLECTVCALEERLASIFEEMVATNRNAIVAESKETEVLHYRLDKALLLNGTLKDQMLMCTEALEGLKTEATLWKVDQALHSIVIDDLHEENSNIRTDLENLKRNKDKVMETLKRMHPAIRIARNYRNPSRDYSWVSSLG